MCARPHCPGYATSPDCCGPARASLWYPSPAVPVLSRPASAAAADELAGLLTEAGFEHLRTEMLDLDLRRPAYSGTCADSADDAELAARSTAAVMTCLTGEILRDRCAPSSETGQSDGVPGGFGGVGAPGWGGPAEGAVGELVDRPFRVLLEAVVVAALGAGVAAAGPAACLVRGVVLDVALGGGPAADGAGAGGVPDLDQVLQRDPGVVAAGLVPVVAGVGGQRFQGDDQVRARRRGCAAARCRSRRAARPGWPG